MSMPNRNTALGSDWRTTLLLPLVALTLTGCATTFPLMPTPVLYTGPQAKPLFTDAPAEHRTPPLDLLYITDRAPATGPDDVGPYTAERSHAMAFGSTTVEFGDGVSWDTLAKESILEKRTRELNLKLGPTKELGRFPVIAYDVQVTPAGIERAPAVMDVHEKAAAGLQAEVARRLAIAPRKEVVLFVHGYANTFEDAALTMGEMCHFLGREFVCAIFTWPAGGTKGVFAGYDVDRESGEFAVQHLKTAIRLIASTPGVEHIHLLAHSRGTDVLATAMREINIETYVEGVTIGKAFKVQNMVLMAPDIDADVAVTKIFGVASDPELVHGKAPDPRGVFPSPGMHITVYSSPNDKALTLSQFLYGSALRVGRIQESALTKEQIEKAEHYQSVIDLISVTGTPGFIGHSYFHDDPEVSADLIAMIRYGLKPGEPGRPLEEIRRPFWRIPTKP